MDTDRLKRRAKENLENGVAALKRWWSKKYELPPNHPLFLEQSMANLQQERFEDLYTRRQEIEMEMERGEGDHEEHLKHLSLIAKALGEAAYVHDPLVDQWERELLEGKIPDLDARVPEN